MHQLFGAELPKVIEELNRELAAWWSLLSSTARLDSGVSERTIKTGGCRRKWKRRYCGPADAAAGAIDGSDPREIRLTAKRSMPNMRSSAGRTLFASRVSGSQSAVGRSIRFQATRVCAHCDRTSIPLATESKPLVRPSVFGLPSFNSQTVGRHIG